MGKFIIGLIIVVLLIAGIVYYNSANKKSISGESIASDSVAAGSGNSNHVVEMSEKGFSPKELTIKRGDAVKFANIGTIEQWPASAMHPTHTVYPGSDIKKCGIGEEKNIFDSCRDIKPGESWSFTFNEKGTWGYHDHSNAGIYGKIIVN
ncbi:MAG: plastocyanin/azurin family copper-binding protein [Nanoarchaeota archaeon]